jgi:primase-polymerase (primpol)-like protein
MSKSSTAATITPALEALQPGQQWICYRADKVPFSPFMPYKGAKADDPETWGTYEQALRTWKA